MAKWDKENILAIDVSGKSYVEAIAIAQDNIDFFIKVFQAESTTNFKFYIKARFEEEEYVEHLWLIAISFNDDKFIAIVNNEPNDLRGIKYEDILVVNKTEVEDWIIKTDSQEIIGNFIYNALKNDKA